MNKLDINFQVGGHIYRDRSDPNATWARPEGEISLPAGMCIILGGFAIISVLGWMVS